MFFRLWRVQLVYLLLRGFNSAQRSFPPQVEKITSWTHQWKNFYYSSYYPYEESDKGLIPVPEFKRLSPPEAEITELNPPEADSLTTLRKNFLVMLNVLPPVAGPIGLSPGYGREIIPWTHQWKIFYYSQLLCLLGVRYRSLTCTWLPNYL